MTINKCGFSYISVLITIVLVVCLAELLFQGLFFIKNSNDMLKEKEGVFFDAYQVLHEKLYTSNPGIEVLVIDEYVYRVTTIQKENLKKVEIEVYKDSREIEKIYKYRFTGGYVEDDEN